MPDVKISALVAATAAGDADLVPIVQAGATKRATVAHLRAGLATTTALTSGLAGKANTAHTHVAADVSGLATVATSGAYGDLTGRPTLGTAAATDATAYATAAQGAKADTAVQPGALATVATTGAYGDLSGRPTLGTAAATDATAYATAAQGAKADTAVQPGNLATVATTGAYADLTGAPAAYSLPTASASVLGGVKVGSGLAIAGDGTLSATGSGGGGDMLQATYDSNGDGRVNSADTLADGTNTVTAAQAQGAVTHAAVTSGNPHGTTAADVGAAPASHVHTISDVTGLQTALDGKTATGHTHTVADVSGLGGAATLNVGTTAGTVAAGDDSRLTNARTPTAHAATHATGGGDEITPAAIGAAPLSHTHTASQISDSTATGRALVTAADAAVARSTLGLGTAATTDTSAYATAAQGATADAALPRAGGTMSGTINANGNDLTNVRRGARQVVPLAYAATVTPVMADGMRRILTLTGSATLNAPTGAAAGDSLVVEVVRSSDAHLLSFASAYKFAATPSWPNGSTRGVLVGDVMSDGNIVSAWRTW